MKKAVQGAIAERVEMFTGHHIINMQEDINHFLKHTKGHLQDVKFSCYPVQGKIGEFLALVIYIPK